MHKSQLAGFIIDCHTDDVDAAAEFWGAALGLEKETPSQEDEADYRYLQTPEDALHIEVQKVDHASRVHLDIETDDIEAEVKRLESLGAKRLGPIKRWVVMEAPTGQRFCVVQPVRSNFQETAKQWD